MNAIVFPIKYNFVLFGKMPYIIRTMNFSLIVLV